MDSAVARAGVHCPRLLRRRRSRVLRRDAVRQDLRALLAPQRHPVLRPPPGAGATMVAFIAAIFPAHAIAEFGVGMPVDQMLVAFVTNCAVALLNAFVIR